MYNINIYFKTRWASILKHKYSCPKYFFKAEESDDAPVCLKSDQMQQDNQIWMTALYIHQILLKDRLLEFLNNVLTGWLVSECIFERLTHYISIWCCYEIDCSTSSMMHWLTALELHIWLTESLYSYLIFISGWLRECLIFWLVALLFISDWLYVSIF